MSEVWILAVSSHSLVTVPLVTNIISLNFNFPHLPYSVGDTCFAYLTLLLSCSEKTVMSENLEHYIVMTLAGVILLW